MKVECGEVSRMKKFKVWEDLECGLLYFYVHFVVEVLCFFVLARLIGDSPFLWLAPLFYDVIAFVPQGIIGYIYDRFKKFNCGLWGLFLLLFGFICFGLDLVNPYIAILFIALGNAFLHVQGAEITLRVSAGKLAPSAIFVAGGSFGVVTGKLLGTTVVSFWILVIFALSTIPFILLADSYINEKNNNCEKFDYVKENSNQLIIVIALVFFVAVRGYMGYGLPTSWNKTVLQTVILYVAMGLGKALGGILSDIYGLKKVGIGSCLLSLPFLLLGDNLMFVSLIGVLFFSMTMSITLALLVSVFKQAPGLAFGMTTLGLFLGSVPIFIFRITSVLINCFIIVILTLLCVIILMKVIRKDKEYE